MRPRGWQVLDRLQQPAIVTIATHSTVRNFYNMTKFSVSIQSETDLGYCAYWFLITIFCFNFSLPTLREVLFKKCMLCSPPHASYVITQPRMQATWLLNKIGWLYLIVKQGNSVNILCKRDFLKPTWSVFSLNFIFKYNASDLIIIATNLLSTNHKG